MKLLFIGDIMGRGGRRVIQDKIPNFIKENKVDYCIVNGENMAGGKGMSPKTYEQMCVAGVDAFTSGNHIWSNKNIFPLMEEDPILRPANYPDSNKIPGKGFMIVKTDFGEILIINLIGRIFMGKDYDCPFRKADQILLDHESKDLTAIIVDFHAEATSEKIALKHYLDGRVTAVFGTHTHVPTADAEITEKGTAYITDVGFSGPTDSVLGMKKEIVLDSFLTQLPTKFEVSTGPSVCQAILIKIEKMKAISIEQIQIKE